MSWLDDHRLLLSGFDVRVYDTTSRATTVLNQTMAQATMMDASSVLVMGERWDVFSVASLAKTGTLDCDSSFSFGPRGRMACQKDGQMRLVDLAGSAPKKIDTIRLDEDETWSTLAARLAHASNVVVNGSVIWRADTGDPIVAVEWPPLSVGGGGAFVWSSFGPGNITVLKLGARAARTYACEGAVSYDLDPKLPVAYATKGQGHSCTIDLLTGRTTNRGSPPPPRKNDCCGSPHILALGDGLAFQNGGFTWSTLVDAKTGATIDVDGEPLTDTVDAAAPGVLLMVTDAHHDELLSFETRTRTQKWRRPIWGMVGASAPEVATSPDKKRLALLRTIGDAEPTIFDVASGRVLSPPDALDAAIFGDDGALYTRTASGAVQRWDLANGSVADAPTFPTKKHGTRAEIRERCLYQAVGPELDASPDGGMTACYRRGRVVIVVGTNGAKSVEIEPRPSQHAGVVFDGDAFDLVGDEAVATMLECRADAATFPFEACASRLRKRGLLRLR
jgi:hypothetical protein